MRSGRGFSTPAPCLLADQEGSAVRGTTADQDGPAVRGTTDREKEEPGSRNRRGEGTRPSPAQDATARLNRAWLKRRSVGSGCSGAHTGRDRSRPAPSRTVMQTWKRPLAARPRKAIKWSRSRQNSVKRRILTLFPEGYTQEKRTPLRAHVSGGCLGESLPTPAPGCVRTASSFTLPAAVRPGPGAAPRNFLVLGGCEPLCHSWT